VTSSRSICW